MNQTNGVLLAWLWLFGPNIALLLGPIVVHIDSIYHPKCKARTRGQWRASSQAIAWKLVMVSLGGKQHRQPNHDAGIIHIAWYKFYMEVYCCAVVVGSWVEENIPVKYIPNNEWEAAQTIYLS